MIISSEDDPPKEQIENNEIKLTEAETQLPRFEELKTKLEGLWGALEKLGGYYSHLDMSNIELLLSLLTREIKSLFDDFSGYYLAITLHSFEAILLEIIECQHVDSKLTGQIRGLCFVESKNGKLIEKGQNRGDYRFDGIVDKRLFALVYCTTFQGIRNSGTLTLQGDVEGKYFIGYWVGSSSYFNEVKKAFCIWARIESDIALSGSRECLVQEAEKILREYRVEPEVEERPGDAKLDEEMKERIQSLQKQMRSHWRNLNNLEEAAAQHGILDIPLKLRNEIKETKDKIAEIKEELEKLIGRRAELSLDVV